MSDEIRAERLIEAPPERVFDAFVSPEGQREFYGKDSPGWVVESRCDLRVGGTWSVSFGPSRSELYRHDHVFSEIERPRRLRMRTTETRLDGSSFAIDTEFVFEGRGEGATLMTLAQSGFPTEALREEHTVGVPHAFARLERLLAEPVPPIPREGERVSKSVLYMSMSLDGFIAGPADEGDQGLGVDGEILHAWLGAYEDRDGDGVPGFDPPGSSRIVFDEQMATGAVVTGRRTFDHGNKWGGDHHDGVPIFVPTRGEPPADFGCVHYVTDGVESAMAQAKEAAGEKNVMVHGADFAQSLMRAGVLDELQIHLVPVLLGEGRRLFEHLGAEHTELELMRIVDAPGVTHLRYRVVK